MPTRIALRRLAILAFFAVGLAACQTAGTSPEGTQPASLPDPSPTAPLEPLFFTMEPQPLLPTDYAAAVMAGVADGRWSLDQGLVAGLTAAAGLAEPDPAFAVLASLEGTGLVRLARHYLASQPTGPQSGEIERLLSILIPSPAALERYAAPEGSHAARPPGLAQPLSQVDCRSLAFRGFPEDEAATCLLYRSLTVQGDEYRIYYPTDWAPEHPFRAYLDLTAEAIRDSVNSYSALGEMGPARVVFSLLTAEEDIEPGEDLIDAVADPAEDGACQVVVYPDSLARGVEEGDFKQLVAHEFFHCYEFDNLTAQERGPHPDANSWWVEGAAEYFSNVVYPANDDEHGWLQDFVARSESVSLVDMEYETYLFFQYLENRQGVDGVLALLQAMPTSGGRAEQLAALAAHGDLFHEFARAFLDNRIQDSSGRQVVIRHDSHLGPVVVVEGPLAEPFRASPFVLARHRLAFVPGKQYEGLRLQPLSGDGQHSARPADAPGAWPGLPASLEASCPAPLYLMTLTNPMGADSLYEVSLEVSVSDVAALGEVECEDPCLIGGWELINSSYYTYFDATAGAGTNMSVLAVDGSYTIRFDDQGFATGTMRDFTSQILRRDEPTDMVLTFTMNGEGRGAYWATGSVVFLTGVDYSEFTTTGSVDVGGMVIPLDPMHFGESTFEAGSLLATGSYVCTDEILYWTPPIPGQPVGLLQFQRVDR